MVFIDHRLAQIKSQRLRFLKIEKLKDYESDV